MLRELEDFAFIGCPETIGPDESKLKCVTCVTHLVCSQMLLPVFESCNFKLKPAFDLGLLLSYVISNHTIDHADCMFSECFLKFQSMGQKNCDLKFYIKITHDAEYFGISASKNEKLIALLRLMLIHMLSVK